MTRFRDLTALALVLTLLTCAWFVAKAEYARNRATGGTAIIRTFMGREVSGWLFDRLDWPPETARTEWISTPGNNPPPQNRAAMEELRSTVGVSRPRKTRP